MTWMAFLLLVSLLNVFISGAWLSVSPQQPSKRMTIDLEVGIAVETSRRAIEILLLEVCLCGPSSLSCRCCLISFVESNFPPRAELPLPTQPPYMAFVGNLSFDIYEDAIAEFFAPSATKSIKIIKDRDEKPKGFGYVEFETLDGLKDGLSRSGGVSF
ncbi:hypothetical protein DL93DRAFT_2075816 [Clavulina sp. PMI_390]|nr:hypothetical protein DL93DRAFT_2075816 [Clavulina sp. PMI_390]